MKAYLYFSISYWNRVISYNSAVCLPEGMLCIENTLVSSNYQNCNHMLYIIYTFYNSRIPWYGWCIFVHFTCIQYPFMGEMSSKHLSVPQSSSPLHRPVTRVLVTGATGLLGRQVMQLFSSTNWEAGRRLGHLYNVGNSNFCLTCRCVAFAKAGHKLHEFCPVIWYKKMPFGISCRGSSPRLGCCGTGFKQESCVFWSQYLKGKTGSIWQVSWVWVRFAWLSNCAKCWEVVLHIAAEWRPEVLRQSPEQARKLNVDAAGCSDMGELMNLGWL